MRVSKDWRLNQFKFKPGVNAQPLPIGKTKISMLPELANKKANLAVGVFFEAMNCD
jgi:hypothetical protein